MSEFLQQCLKLYIWGSRLYPDEAFKPVWGGSSGLTHVKVVDEEVSDFIEESFKHVNVLIAKVPASSFTAILELT